MLPLQIDYKFGTALTTIFVSIATINLNFLQHVDNAYLQPTYTQVFLLHNPHQNGCQIKKKCNFYPPKLCDCLVMNWLLLLSCYYHHVPKENIPIYNRHYTEHPLIAIFGFYFFQQLHKKNSSDQYKLKF